MINSDTMSASDSLDTRHGGMSGFRSCAAISAALHMMIVVIIGRSTIAGHEQMRPIETYLVAYPSNAVAAPGQSTISTRVFSERHPAQATPFMPLAPAFPGTTAAPVKSGQPDTPHITETAVALNPVHQALEAGVAKESREVVAAPAPSQTGQYTGVAGVSESLGDMVMGESGAPLFIHRQSPIYPFLARKFGKEGRVVVRVTLDDAGRQKAIEVVEPGDFGFTDAAVTALKQSMFSPARKNGKAVPSRVLVPVRFVLSDAVGPSPAGM